MENGLKKAPRVHLLSEDVILKMAAGEIVERPASVVKELMENSVDAGAARVEVRIEKAGMELISVSDDGCGIEPEDLALAVGRHATSKLSCEEDLHAIRTLGFRGEALASIASVSRLEIVSRPPDAGIGGRIVVEGGRIIERGRFGAPVGTRVDVKDLFYNTPVRKKFVRSAQTESARVAEAVANVALGHPGVYFRLVSGGRSVIDCGPAAGVVERARSILAEDLLFEIAGGEDRLNLVAACGGPALSRGDMSGIHILINGRHVMDRGLKRIVSNAFSNVLPSGRFPLAVIALELPVSEVDINVHPQKTEVRFLSPSRINGFVSKAVTSAVAKAPWLHGKVYRLGASPDGGDLPEPGSDAQYLGRIAEALKRYDPARDRAGHQDRGHGETAAEPAWRAGISVTEARGFFSSLRFVGQVLGMYLVFEGDSSIVLVDQHAAAERIAFQQLMEAWRTGRRVSQQLLIPIEIGLSARHAALVERHIGTLGGMGIDLEPFGVNSFIVRGLPEAVAGSDPKVVVTDIVEELESVGGETSLTALVADIASRVACHAVVRGAKTLGEHEAAALARRLDGVDFGVACPHGRPVYFEIGRPEIEKRFSRR